MFILFGAIVSWYVGMMFIDCAEKTNSTRYEDFADACFGPFWAKVTGWVNIVCLIGFGTSYIVFIKLLVPHVLIVLFYGDFSIYEDPLPTLFGEGLYTG